MKDWPIPDCPQYEPYRPRTAAVVANEKWIVWLNELDPVARERVMRNELFYFDAFASGLMSTDLVLNHAFGLTYA